MSVEIAWKQNILVTDSYLLKLLLVVFGLGLQAFVCDFSRQNICSVGSGVKPSKRFNPITYLSIGVPKSIIISPSLI